MHPRFWIFFPLAIVLFCSTPERIKAAESTWQPGPFSQNWNDSGNWSTGSPPGLNGNQDSALFTLTPPNPFLNDSLVIPQIRFSQSNNTIEGPSGTITGTTNLILIAENGSHATIQSAIHLTSPQTLTIQTPATSSLTLAGLITFFNSTALTQTGKGILDITGPINYSGGPLFTITGDHIQFNNNSMVINSNNATTLFNQTRLTMNSALIEAISNQSTIKISESVVQGTGRIILQGSTDFQVTTNSQLDIQSINIDGGQTTVSQSNIKSQSYISSGSTGSILFEEQSVANFPSFFAAAPSVVIKDSTFNAGVFQGGTSSITEAFLDISNSTVNINTLQIRNSDGEALNINISNNSNTHLGVTTLTGSPATLNIDSSIVQFNKLSFENNSQDAPITINVYCTHSRCVKNFTAS